MMRKKLSAAVVAFSMFFSVSVLAASPAEFPVFEDIFSLSSGELWSQMTPDVKHVYIRGVMDGIQNQYLFGRLYQDDLVDELSTTIGRDKREKAEASLTKFSLKTSLTANLTSQIPVGELIAGLDSFYKDRRNGDIPIVLASTVIYLQHSGYDKAEVASHVEQLRMDSERYTQSNIGKR